MVSSFDVHDVWTKLLHEREQARDVLASVSDKGSIAFALTVGPSIAHRDTPAITGNPCPTFGGRWIMRGPRTSRRLFTSRLHCVEPMAYVVGHDYSRFLGVSVHRSSSAPFFTTAIISCWQNLRDNASPARNMFFLNFPHVCS